MQAVVLEENRALRVASTPHETVVGHAWSVLFRHIDVPDQFLISVILVLVPSSVSETVSPAVKDCLPSKPQKPVRVREGLIRECGFSKNGLKTSKCRFLV